MNKTKMTQYTEIYLEQCVQPRFDNTGGTVEEKAVRLLQRSFAQQLADGDISMTNLKLSAFVLAGRVDEHELIPGLLSAHYESQQSGCWRRGISSGKRKEATEEMLQAMRNIARATLFLSSRLKNRVSTLKALKLFHQSAEISQEALPPVEAFGAALHLPRPFQAINFDGAEVECYKRAENIIKYCLGLVLSAPCWLYAAFDGTYLTRALDMSPAGTTYDDEARCLGPSCEFQGANDRSARRFADVAGDIDKTLKAAAKAGSAAGIVENETLGSEIFEIFVHSACHRLRDVLIVMKEMR